MLHPYRYDHGFNFCLYLIYQYRLIYLITHLHRELLRWKSGRVGAWAKIFLHPWNWGENIQHMCIFSMNRKIAVFQIHNHGCVVFNQLHCRASEQISKFHTNKLCQASSLIVKLEMDLSDTSDQFWQETINSTHHMTLANSLTSFYFCDDSRDVTTFSDKATQRRLWKASLGEADANDDSLTDVALWMTRVLFTWLCGLKGESREGASFLW